MSRIMVKGEVDDRALKQLERCAEAGEAPAAALCADGHVGYSMPIGGVVAYRDKISPSGVGFDIGCGNYIVKTEVWVPSLHSTEIVKIVDEIASRISFGMGRNNNEPVDHQVLDEINQASFIPQRNLSQLAINQLGTVGSGNHYVDLFEGDDRYIWVGVHFGSRGFGHKTASGFLALSQGLSFDGKANDGEMDSPPVLFDTNSELGQSYIEAMTLAGKYAYAGREVVVNKVLEILQSRVTEGIHNHHNYAWLENHGGEDLWVIRKGATPAFPGQKGFVGATMGEPSVILEGVDHPDMKGLLYSTVHGAGRVMSRTQAAGKVKRRKYWECSDRDCDYRTVDGSQPCLAHGSSKMVRRWYSEQVKKGLIDFKYVQNDLISKEIILRGGAADEAPEAYKRLDEVLDYHKDTIKILHTLKPIGVIMAGKDIYDPFKD